MKGNVPDDAIALVEDGEDAHALRHRRNARTTWGCGGLARRGLSLPLGSAVARGNRESQEQQGDRTIEHAYSGIQGW
jgi:hypothetical protein